MNNKQTYQKATPDEHVRPELPGVFMTFFL